MPFLQKSEYFCTICIISRESACFVYYDIVHFSFFAKSEYRFEDRSFSTLLCTCRLDKSIHESEVICLYSPSTGSELRFERVLLFIVSICRFTTVDDGSVVHIGKVILAIRDYTIVDLWDISTISSIHSIKFPSISWNSLTSSSDQSGGKYCLLSCIGIIKWFTIKRVIHPFSFIPLLGKEIEKSTYTILLNHFNRIFKIDSFL